MRFPETDAHRSATGHAPVPRPAFLIDQRTLGGYTLDYDWNGMCIRCEPCTVRQMGQMDVPYYARWARRTNVAEIYAWIHEHERAAGHAPEDLSPSTPLADQLAFSHHHHEPGGPPCRDLHEDPAVPIEVLYPACVHRPEVARYLEPCIECSADIDAIDVALTIVEAIKAEQLAEAEMAGQAYRKAAEQAGFYVPQLRKRSTGILPVYDDDVSRETKRDLERGQWIKPPAPDCGHPVVRTPVGPHLHVSDSLPGPVHSECLLVCYACGTCWTAETIPPGILVELDELGGLPAVRGAIDAAVPFYLERPNGRAATIPIPTGVPDLPQPGVLDRYIKAVDDAVRIMPGEGPPR